MCKSASAVGEKKTSSGPGVREAVNVQPTCRQDEIDSLLFFLLLLAFSTHLTTLARSGPKQRVAFERLILNNPILMRIHFRLCVCYRVRCYGDYANATCRVSRKLNLISPTLAILQRMWRKALRKLMKKSLWVLMTFLKRGLLGAIFRRISYLQSFKSKTIWPTTRTWMKCSAAHWPSQACVTCLRWTDVIFHYFPWVTKFNDPGAFVTRTQIL